MKVKELIGLNALITDVCIEVRKNGGEIVDCLFIGPDYGVKPPYPLTMHPGTARKKEATYIIKNLNARDDKHEYFEIKPERIPAKWLELEVYSWRYRSVWKRHHYFDDNSMQGIEIVALPSGESLEIPKEKTEKPTGWEHLDGQISLFDLEATYAADRGADKPV